MKTRAFPIPREWNPFQDIERELGRFFESLEPVQSVRVPRLFPPVNLYENGPEYILTAEVPGMEPDSLDLSLVGETLTLRGERRGPRGSARRAIAARNARSASGRARSPCPTAWTAPRCPRHYAHGILTVTLPKTEEAKPRQIAVTTTP